MFVANVVCFKRKYSAYLLPDKFIMEKGPVRVRCEQLIQLI